MFFHRQRIRFLNCIIQLGASFCGDGMEGVCVLGFSIGLVGAEGHIHDDFIILFGDTNIVYREGASDCRAGKCLGGAVAIQYFVDPYMDIDGAVLLSGFHDLKLRLKGIPFCLEFGIFELLVECLAEILAYKLLPITFQMPMRKLDAYIPVRSGLIRIL